MDLASRAPDPGCQRQDRFDMMKACLVRRFPINNPGDRTAQAVEPGLIPQPTCKLKC
jgi:hypothetical protein